MFTDYYLSEKFDVDFPYGSILQWLPIDLIFQSVFYLNIIKILYIRN